MSDNRALSQNFLDQLFRPYRDKDIRPLLTINHPTFTEPFRFVSGDPNEFETLTSNGNVFQTFPFELRILSDTEGSPQANLRISNVDDRIGTTIKDLPEEALQITIQIVLRETPDVIEYEATNLELVDIEVNVAVITGSIVIRGLATESCPGRVLTNRISPGFFR